MALPFAFCAPRYPVGRPLRAYDEEVLAGRHGTTTRAIRSLNGLRNSRLTVGQVLRVPKGTREPLPRQERVYCVKKGDSPYLVARRHRMNLAEFLRINNLTPSSTIYPGQTLVITNN